MAIMGFGGGAFLAGYLNVFFIARLGVARTVVLKLSIDRDAARASCGVAQDPARRLGRSVGLAGYDGSQPDGIRRLGDCNSSAVGILFINVTAGIGILAQASPMMQVVSEDPAAGRGGGLAHQYFQCGREIVLGVVFGFHRTP
jgi:hypothetical protein